MTAFRLMGVLHVVALTTLAFAQPQNATITSSTNHAAIDRVGWVSSTPGRSTMNIVWSCVSILLVCTYKCLHFNIPSFEEKEAGWHKVMIKQWSIPYWPEWLIIRKYLVKLGWILAIIVAPELGVGVAVKEFFEAYSDLEGVRNRWPDLEVGLVHAFYAKMGGFAIDRNYESAVSATSSPEPRALRTPQTPRDGGDEASESVNSAIVMVSSLQEDSQNRGHTSQTTQARSSDLEKLLPPPIAIKAPKNLGSLSLYKYAEICHDTTSGTVFISTEDIKDRNKTDSFTKIFAVGQSTWLIVQSIARVSSGLPLSQLELATMAYIIPAVVIYGFWWEKPFGVEHVTIVRCRTDFFCSHWATTSPFDNVGNEVLDFTSQTLKQSIAFYVVATLFSAVHLGAWNWEFPVPVARLLWRISGVFAIAAGPCLIVTFLALSKWGDYLGGHAPLGVTVGSVAIFIFLGYIISREVLFGLIIYSLSSMPYGVYMTIDWTTYFPFLS